MQARRMQDTGISKGGARIPVPSSVQFRLTAGGNYRSSKKALTLKPFLVRTWSRHAGRHIRTYTYVYLCMCACMYTYIYKSYIRVAS